MSDRIDEEERLRVRAEDAERTLRQALTDIVESDRKLRALEADVGRAAVAWSRERRAREAAEESKRRCEVALAKVRLAIGDEKFRRIVGGT